MLRDFLFCGIIGWTWEIAVTGLATLFSPRQPFLVGHTSLLMFPIYGAACLIGPVSRRIAHYPFWLRGLFYTIMIFAGEYISGRFLQLHHICPWNYEHAALQVDGVIRLDYAPAWFLLGLIYEKALSKKHRKI